MRYKNCQVVSVVNFKGGVGKSTITMNLGSELANNGMRVLIIDYDAQGNLTRFSGISGVGETLIDSLFDVMAGKEPKDHIYKVQKNLDIIPCNVMKEKWMIEVLSKLSRETVLKRYLDGVKHRHNYDLILIDNAPSINIDLQNSLVASDRYLIVTEADMVSIDGINNVLGVIGQIKLYCNPDLCSAGIIINKYEHNTNLHRYTREAITEMYGDDHHVYRNIIPKSIDAGMSGSSGISVQEYKKNSKIAEAFRHFAREYVQANMQYRAEMVMDL